MGSNGRTEARRHRGGGAGHGERAYSPVALDVGGRAAPEEAIEELKYASKQEHPDDTGEVVPEAYALVEHGLLSEDDFRDLIFENAVRFWGEVNPDFFKGTVVEKQAAEVLARGR